MSRLRSSIGANQPWVKPREAMPRCTDSQMAQSWRLTRSQKSAASLGSNVSRATSSAAKSRSHTIRVWPADVGHKVNAATCSADRLIMRFG
jgi:hypothetical protein